MKNSNFFIFIVVFSYLLVWSAIPTLINHNIDYDLAQQYSQGVEYLWGYHHPPLSFFLPSLFFEVFPRTDFNYYLFAQINVSLAFFAMGLLARDLFGMQRAFLSVLLLMLIPFFNTFATKYNANSALYFPWAFSLCFAYFALFQNKWWQWLGLGFFCALTVLAKYFALVLLISLLSLIFIKTARKRLKQIGPYLALVIFFITLSFHLLWLFNHQISLSYAETKLFSGDFWQARLEGFTFLITFPLYLIFVFMALIFCLKKIPLLSFMQFKSKDEKGQFLWLVCIFPWLMVGVFSMIFNLHITGIWAMPIWLSAPLLIIYHLEELNYYQINQLIKTSIIMIVVFACLVLSYHFFKKRIHDEYSFPSKQIINLINEDWNKISANPFRAIVTNDPFLADNLKFYAKREIDILKFAYINHLVQIDKKQAIQQNHQKPWQNSVIICNDQNPSCMQKLNLLAKKLKATKSKIHLLETTQLFYKTKEVKLTLIYLP